MYLCVLGVEVRENGFAVLEDCEITNSGSQGLVAHAGALGCIASRSATFPLLWNFTRNLSKAHETRESL